MFGPMEKVRVFEAKEMVEWVRFSNPMGSPVAWIAKLGTEEVDAPYCEYSIIQHSDPVAGASEKTILSLET